MHYLLSTLAFTHVLAGVIALITGPLAMIAGKADQLHRKAGKIYFYAMTWVFVSAVALSAIKFIPFLFMLSFLSYYACFSGVRILKLKQLHKGQRAKWYDWFAGGLTGLAGLLFMIYGLVPILQGEAVVLSWLSLFFGAFSLQAAYTGVRPYFMRPQEPRHWWFYHLNSMMASFIAASTAFSTTIGRITEFNHWILWVGPAMVGIPLISLWQRHYKKKFGISAVR